ncbi:hypothetical protein LguiB_022086 [Lonicera macranthoides]
MEDMEECLINPVDIGKEVALEPERSVRKSPPAHYRLKIESFSLISKLLGPVNNYESHNFEIGGYKWKLSLYPDGDKKRDGSGHISLYLVLADPNNLPLGLEVIVLFKLFVYDQIRDNYLTIQDVNSGTRRFNAMNTEWGFPKLLQLTTFKNSDNGYLVDDCCIFGAEVFVSNPLPKGETISIINVPKTSSSFKWAIQNFSRLKQDVVTSQVFTAAGHAWSLMIYPKGDSSVKDKKSLSLFLCLKDCSSLEPGQCLYVNYNLLINDQAKNNHHLHTACSKFSSSLPDWGFSDFMPLSDLNVKSKGLMVNDVIKNDLSFADHWL